MNYNHLIDSLKIPTKIWRCHVMFLKKIMQKYISISRYFEFYTKFSNLVRRTVLHYNLFKYLFKTSTKFWDVNMSMLINFLQKPSVVLWNIWVNQPLFHSGPTWWVVQQLYFKLLLYPWFLFLLVVLPAKPLSPRGWTHWSNSSSCNHAQFFLSWFEVLQNLH